MTAPSVDALVEQVRERLAKAARGRERFVQGTPENYPLTLAEAITVLEVEAMVAVLDTLRERLEALTAENQVHVKLVRSLQERAEKGEIRAREGTWKT